MGKKSSHLENGGPKASRQAIRSRDENQERAYVAASRRKDRSIEARLESAHKASELHKKRTGRHLRITEQIVFNDENYEEVDRWTQSRVQLGPHMQTASSEFNSRVEAYLEHRLAMSSFMAGAQQQPQPQHWSEIDSLFAASFPNATKDARRLAQEILPSGSADSQPAKTTNGADAAPHREDVDKDLSQANIFNDEPIANVQNAQIETTRSINDHAMQDSDSPFTADLPNEVSLLLGGNGAMESRFEPPLKQMTDTRNDTFESKSPLEQNDYSNIEELNPWDNDLELFVDSRAWDSPPVPNSPNLIT